MKKIKLYKSLIISIFFLSLHEGAFAFNCKKCSKKNAIILIGPPASGKGYISDKILENTDYNHISMGDVLRKSASNETKKKMSKGQLVDDSEIESALNNYISELKITEGVIFDGAPRKKSQMKMLNKVMKKNNLKISKIIILKCDDKTLVSRMEKRAKNAKKKRSDDNIVVFKKRLNTYKQESKPIIGKYLKKKKNLILHIDCKQTDKVNISDIIENKSLKKNGKK